MEMPMSLKSLRVDANLTRTQVSEATGIAENTLANYENFVSKPDITKAMILASFYKRSVDDIRWSNE